MIFDVNHWPARCPYGHDLGPGTASLSWDMKIKRHWLLCNGCGGKTGIVLELDSAQWQVHRGGRWVIYGSCD